MGTDYATYDAYRHGKRGCDDARSETRAGFSRTLESDDQGAAKSQMGARPAGPLRLTFSWETSPSICNRAVQNVPLDGRGAARLGYPAVGTMASRKVRLKIGAGDDLADHKGASPA